jgi:hypothetical protein
LCRRAATSSPSATRLRNPGHRVRHVQVQVCPQPFEPALDAAGLSRTSLTLAFVFGYHVICAVLAQVGFGLRLRGLLQNLPLPHAAAVASSR